MKLYLQDMARPLYSCHGCLYKPTQGQNIQHSSMEERSSPKSPPLTEKLAAVDDFWDQENLFFSNVTCSSLPMLSKWP